MKHYYRAPHGTFVWEWDTEKKAARWLGEDGSLIDDSMLTLSHADNYGFEKIVPLWLTEEFIDMGL